MGESCPTFKGLLRLIGLALHQSPLTILEVVEMGKVKTVLQKWLELL